MVFFHFDNSFAKMRASSHLQLIIGSVWRAIFYLFSQRRNLNFFQPFKFGRSNSFIDKLHLFLDKLSCQIIELSKKWPTADSTSSNSSQVPGIFKEKHDDPLKSKKNDIKNVSLFPYFLPCFLVSYEMMLLFMLDGQCTLLYVMCYLVISGGDH